MYCEGFLCYIRKVKRYASPVIYCAPPACCCMYPSLVSCIYPTRLSEPDHQTRPQHHIVLFLFLLFPLTFYPHPESGSLHCPFYQKLRYSDRVVSLTMMTMMMMRRRSTRRRMTWVSLTIMIRIIG